MRTVRRWGWGWTLIVGVGAVTLALACANEIRAALICSLWGNLLLIFAQRARP